MPLIFIYGPVASGKLTIARKLSERTNIALFHNHLVVDAVAAVFPFGSEPFVRLREQMWLAVFEEAARTDRSLIFTFAPEPTVTPGFIDRTRDVVRSHGGDVVFVALTVSPEEQERRLVNPDRASFGKMRSLELLRALRDQFAASEAAMPRPALMIDTNVIEPEAAAEAIMRAI